MAQGLPRRFGEFHCRSSRQRLPCSTQKSRALPAFGLERDRNRRPSSDGAKIGGVEVQPDARSPWPSSPSPAKFGDGVGVAVDLPAVLLGVAGVQVQLVLPGNHRAGKVNVAAQLLRRARAAGIVARGLDSAGQASRCRRSRSRRRPASSASIPAPRPPSPLPRPRSRPPAAYCSFAYS